MSSNLQLYKRKSQREGFEKYTDLFLRYEYNGKQYEVRIRPVFGGDFLKLFASAIDLDKSPVPSDNL